MNGKRPDITILLPDLRPGGAERVCLNLAQGFRERARSVDLLLMNRSGRLSESVPAGVAVVSLDVVRLRSVLLPLVRYLRGRRPHALLVAMWPLTVIAALACRIAGTGTRCVVSEHTTFSRSPAVRGGLRRLVLRLSMRLGYSLADAVVAVSFGVRDDLTELSGLPASRYCVVHNPVPPPEPDPDAADEAMLRWWGDGDCARIIAIGSFKPAKDYPTLLRAFAVASRKQAMRLLIVGEGPLRGEIEALIELLGLSDRVRLPGHVPNPYVWLNHADQFVLSSAWEGFGNVIVEAMHCGVPVVSTDCRSGPREILDDGKYGRLVPVGDVDALARAMLDSLAEYHDPAMLRARAHQFSVAQAADDYLALLLPGLASR